MTTDNLVLPSTLRVELEDQLGWYKVVGGTDGHLVVGVFPSELAANYFLNTCVEEKMTFTGVRP